MNFRDKLNLIFACVFLVLSIISFPLQGQSYKDQRFKLGFSTSLDYCFRSISYAGQNSIQEIYYNDAKENETWRLGFSSGLSASYRLSKLISIESGLLYTRRGYGYEDELITAIPDPRFGFVSNTQEANLRINYSFNYVDIPLKCNLNFGLGKHNLIVGAGVVNNLLINSWKLGSITGVAGSASKDRVPMNIPVYRYSISPIMSTGIDLQIGDKSIFRIDLNAQYQVSRLYDDFLTYNLWSAGLNFTYFKVIGKK